MKPSSAPLVRVKLLPPGVQPPPSSVPSVARVQKLRDAAPAAPQAEPSVAERLRATPLTTRKDYVRIPPAFRSRVTVVTVRLEWSEPAQIEALLEPLAQRIPVPA